MLARLRTLGRASLAMLETLGRAGRLWWFAIVRRPRLSALPLVIRQVYQLGVLSVLIIVMSGFSIGAVLALQGYNQLVRYGSESALGLGVALVLVMEIGPVVSALLFAGRAGSAVTAEIGLMKATEQLSSMEMMGVDPLKRIISHMSARFGRTPENWYDFNFRVFKSCTDKTGNWKIDAPGSGNHGLTSQHAGP